MLARLKHVRGLSEDEKALHAWARGHTRRTMGTSAKSPPLVQLLAALQRGKDKVYAVWNVAANLTADFCLDGS